jgi:hypothetical protein
MSVLRVYCQSTAPNTTKHRSAGLFRSISGPFQAPQSTRIKGRATWRLELAGGGSGRLSTHPGRSIPFESYIQVTVTHPSHASASCIRLMNPSRPSESRTRVLHPSPTSESRIRVTHPSHVSEPYIRVMHPSCASESRTHPSHACIRVMHPSHYLNHVVGTWGSDPRESGATESRDSRDSRGGANRDSEP